MQPTISAIGKYIPDATAAALVHGRALEAISKSIIAIGKRFDKVDNYIKDADTASEA